MRRTLLPVFLVLAAVALAGCEPVPRPFDTLTEMAGDNPLVEPGAIRPVSVRAGGPAAEALAPLAETLAEALRETGIPATARPLRPAWTVHIGIIERLADGDTAKLAWTLTRPDGTAAGTAETLSRLDPPDGVVMPRVRAVALRFARIMDPGVDLSPTTVAVGGVGGAPADGDSVLAEAMRRGLERRGMAVVDDAAKADIVVAGTVALAPAEDGAGREITLVWRVTGGDGAVLGRMTQRNTLPDGALADGWTPVATAIAAAAAPGVTRIIAEAGLSP